MKLTLKSHAKYAQMMREIVNDNTHEDYLDHPDTGMSVALMLLFTLFEKGQSYSYTAIQDLLDENEKVISKLTGIDEMTPEMIIYMLHHFDEPYLFNRFDNEPIMNLWLLNNFGFQFDFKTEQEIHNFIISNSLEDHRQKVLELWADNIKNKAA